MSFDDLDRVIGVADFAYKAGDDINARFLGEFLGFDLVTHRRNRARVGGPMNAIFSASRASTKARALRQETITGMNRLGASLLGRIDDLFRD